MDESTEHVRNLSFFQFINLAMKSVSLTKDANIQMSKYTIVCPPLTKHHWNPYVNP